MQRIELRPQIKSGLCVGIHADVYDDEILKVTVGSMGGLGRSLNNAWGCYNAKIMDGVILFSSIAVECAINIDNVTQNERRTNRNNWLNLNPNTLEIAENNNFPVSKLLDPNETIQSQKIKFLDRRNQIAHGEYRDYFSNIRVNSDVGFGAQLNDHIEIPKSEALNQFQKCSDFILAWIKQNPNVGNLSIVRI